MNPAAPLFHGGWDIPPEVAIDATRGMPLESNPSLTATPLPRVIWSTIMFG